VTRMIERHESASSFLERAGARLIEDEARHHLILGIARRCEMEGAPKGAYFATMDDDLGVMSAAVMTPPHGLVTTSLGAAGLDALVDDLDALGQHALPSIHAPRETADAFAERWSKRRRCESCVHWDLRVHALTDVADVPMSPGVLRAARADELDLCASWCAEFAAEIDDRAPLDPREVARRQIDAGALHVWERDGRAVCMAIATGATPHGIRIGRVYTPRDLRGRGYATSCVAALSRAMLASGKRWCFLYTDAKNPTSNAIYARVGYRAIADYRECTFSAR